MLNEKEFENAIETSKDAIYRICSIYAVAPIEPKDLFQEVVLQAWKSFPSFKGHASITTWLYRIALNVCMGAKLKLERKDFSTMEISAIRIESGNVSQEDEEKFEALRQCIASLKEAERSLVIFYLEELPYREIGEVLGLTENHVAVKMKRIRKKLFDCITKNETL